MIKLDIIMSKEALLQYINQPEESDMAFDRWLSLKTLLRQHNIVISDTLIQVYENYFTNEGYGDLFQTYYISQSYHENSQLLDIAEKPEGMTFSKDIIETLLEGKELDNPLYLYDTPSSGHTTIDLKENQRMTCIEELMSDHSIKNPIRRVSVPFITQAIADEDSRKYSVWFYEIFRKEKSVSIYDPFALTIDSLNSLKYYFPFEEGTRVNIYTNTSSSANQENENAIQMLSDIAKQKSITIIINNIGSRKMHGRHLFLSTSNCFVDLDCGIDFLKSGKVRVDCAITLAKMNDEKEAFRRSYNPVRFKTIASNGIIS